MIQHVANIVQSKKPINYAESGDEDEEESEEVFKQLSTNVKTTRASKKQKFSLEDSDDEFGMDAATEAALLDEGEDDSLP